jgi:hypothetical protein
MEEELYMHQPCPQTLAPGFEKMSASSSTDVVFNWICISCHILKIIMQDYIVWTLRSTRSLRYMQEEI